MTRWENRSTADDTALDADAHDAAGIVMEAPEPIFRIDADGIVRYANAKAGELLRPFGSGLGSALPGYWLEPVRALLQSEDERTEISVGERVFDVCASPRADSDWITVQAHDVTHYKAAALDAERQAHLDSLTGLATRSVFRDQLAQTLAMAKRQGRLVGVLVIGLDDFKLINETKGHGAGDDLLRITAERLNRCLRATDLVARLGGDEFAILQPEPAGTAGVDRLARRLNAALREPLTLGGDEVFPAASIGAAVYPDDADDADELLHHADIALDRCKAEGGDRHRFFIAEMNDEVQRRHALEHELRLAIEREVLELHYQPKLDLATGRVAGMEALVRWIHPEMGFVSPAEFIPIAETSRLIIPLGDWVLREACRRTRDWNDAGLGPLKVAVNLSAVQFRNPTLLDDLRRALAETGLPPAYLELEITETAAMDDAEKASEVFDGIARLGISLAIDDFGTGYSSLSYLKNFPVQRIKIDKAFVDDIGHSAKGGAIARAVTTLGQSFDMAVTAEGVETAEQMAFLHGIACQEVQGYFVSKPLPPDAFAAFMQGFDPSPFRPALDRSGLDWNQQRSKWRRGLLDGLEPLG
jgi:diguanylate cyclase (GGDEF)-like protein